MKKEGNWVIFLQKQTSGYERNVKFPSGEPKTITSPEGEMSKQEQSQTCPYSSIVAVSLNLINN